MLPSIRDSASLEPVDKALREAEEWSRKVVGDTVAHAHGARRVYLAFIGSGYAEAAAYTAYWFLRVLSPATRASIHPAEDITYHVLAYREPEEGDIVIAFSEEGGENSLARLGEAARLTGARLIAVTPPIPPVIEARLGESTLLLEIPGRRASIYEIVFSSVFGFQFAREVGGAGGERVKRLEKEVGSYTPVLEELGKRYDSVLEEIREAVEKSPSILVSYTSTMRAPAVLLSSLAEQRGVQALKEPVTATITRIASRRLSTKTLILMATDVEDDTLKELRFKVSMTMPSQQPRLLELRVKTDPLTAPVYGSILVEMLRDKLK